MQNGEAVFKSVGVFEGKEDRFGTAFLLPDNHLAQLPTTCTEVTGLTLTASQSDLARLDRTNGLRKLQGSLLIAKFTQNSLQINKNGPMIWLYVPSQGQKTATMMSRPFKWHSHLQTRCL